MISSTIGIGFRSARSHGREDMPGSPAPGVLGGPGNGEAEMRGHPPRAVERGRGRVVASAPRMIAGGAGLAGAAPAYVAA